MSEPVRSYKFNSMVECSGPVRPCNKCGWNPEVQQRRLELRNAPRPKEQGLKICPA